MECAGVPVVAGVVAASGDAAEKLELPGPFPLFVKPRWEGTAKGIRASSRVEDRAALVREVERIARDYGVPSRVEAFLEGAEYTVTVVGNDPPRALAVLQRALEVTTRIGLHALEPHSAPEGGWQHCLPGDLDPTLEGELARLACRAYDALECLDFARADFRLDAARAEPRLPRAESRSRPSRTDGSFGILAELEGRPLEALLAEVLRRRRSRRLGLS